jgi:hypothetical protein
MFLLSKNYNEIKRWVGFLCLLSLRKKMQLYFMDDRVQKPAIVRLMQLYENINEFLDGSLWLKTRWITTYVRSPSLYSKSTCFHCRPNGLSYCSLEAKNRSRNVYRRRPGLKSSRLRPYGLLQEPHPVLHVRVRGLLLFKPNIPELECNA